MRIIKFEKLDTTLFLIYALRSQRSLRLAVLDQAVILGAAMPRWVVQNFFRNLGTFCYLVVFRYSSIFFILILIFCLILPNKCFKLTPNNLLAS